MNQSLRHMAAELNRNLSDTTILAMHPGEVSTYVHFLQRYVNTRKLMRCRDMQNIDVAWEIDGLLSPEESISGMLAVITTKGHSDSGTFWTWEGNVCPFVSIS